MERPSFHLPVPPGIDITDAGGLYLGKESGSAERAAFLDCGSLLPLSASQPAASAGGQTTDEHSTSGDVLSRPDASRLAGESGSRLPQSRALRAVFQRATKMFEWRLPGDPLLGGGKNWKMRSGCCSVKGIPPEQPEGERGVD